MASTASTVKAAVVLAVCVALLHSSMGQQPPAPAPPPLPYCSNCTSSCVQGCQARYDADSEQCRLDAVAADAACIKDCTRNRCNGNPYAARDSCKQGSCSPCSCGPPCAVDCCKFCGDQIEPVYAQCMTRAGRVNNYCPGYCTSDCYSHCINDTAAAAPSLA